MNVADLARTRRGEIQTDLATLLRAGMSLQREMAEIDTFLKVYDRLTEPRPNATDGQAAEYAVVTPAAAERVTAEDGHASSAPSQANAGDEATVREEVQPALMAEVEPVSRLAAGRTADAGEAGSGLGASPAPIQSSTPARKDVPRSDELAGPVQNVDGVPPAPQNDRADRVAEEGAGVEGVTVGRAPEAQASPRSNGSQAGTQAPPVETIPPAMVDTPEQFVERPPDPVRSEADAREGLTPAAPGASQAEVDADVEEQEQIELGNAEPTPTVRSRVAALHAEHPEYTRRQAMEALGITEGSLAGHGHSLKIRWAPSIPVAAAVEVAPEDEGDPPEPPPAPQVRMEIPGEYTETANKRNEVQDLHASEPWLTPDEAAATLQMPLNNLRIFTQQLDIEWGQLPRPPAPASKVMQPTAGPTLADRVKAQHQLHPTWTARMIAQHLGEKETSVSTLLAIARKETRAQVEAKPEFASKREMLQHYGDVALRLGKGK